MSLKRRVHPFLFRTGLATLAALAALALLTAGLLARSNELYSFQDAVHTRDDVLWGPAFSQMHFPYKLERARLMRPDILVLGSSRANQFRAEMVPGAQFYSGAGATHSFVQTRLFLETLYRDHKPKVVILVVDPWWFRRGEQRDAAADLELNPIEFSYRAMIANLAARAADPTFLWSLITSELDTNRDPISGRRPIGYRAAKLGAGYRPDGSLQYGGFLRNTDPYYDLDGYGWRNQFAYYGRAIREISGRFSHTGPLNPYALDTLRRILGLNREEGVETIILLAPLAAALYQAVEETPPQRGYFARFEAALAEIADAHGAEFHNLHDLSQLGVDDSQTIDGVHGDEVAYLAVVRHMVQAGRALARHIDLDALEALYQRMKDPANRPDPHLIAR